MDKNPSEASELLSDANVSMPEELANANAVVKSEESHDNKMEIKDMNDEEFTGEDPVLDEAGKIFPPHFDVRGKYEFELPVHDFFPKGYSGTGDVVVVSIFLFKGWARYEIWDPVEKWKSAKGHGWKHVDFIQALERVLEYYDRVSTMDRIQYLEYLNDKAKDKMAREKYESLYEGVDLR